MLKKSGEHTLEFLLGFNGHVHRYAGGYWLKFEIARSPSTAFRSRSSK